MIIKLIRLWNKSLLPLPLRIRSSLNLFLVLVLFWLPAFISFFDCVFSYGLHKITRELKINYRPWWFTVKSLAFMAKTGEYQ